MRIIKKDVRNIFHIWFKLNKFLLFLKKAQMKKTPLYDHHVALGAKIVPFAGYEMPVQYQGVLKEHMAVRNVISPEGCASILWKSAEKAPLAAEAMGVGAEQIKTLGLINEIIQEPLGGAHRNHMGMAANYKATIKQQLAQLKELSLDELKAQRYERLMSFGYC